MNVLKKILIVEDDQLLNRTLAYNLTSDGYEVISVFNFDSAVRKLRENEFDVALLDINLPDGSGLDLCEEIRNRGQHTYIIFITANDKESDMLKGYEVGGADYVTKPFGVRELMARVKANLRKSVVREEAPEQAPAGKGNFGKLDINPDRYEVRKDGRIIDLTVREFELLKYLSAQKGQVFSRETLLEKVWGYEYFGDVRTVDVTIRRLREKIEDDPGKPVYILTKRGVGYYFDC